MLAHRFTKLLTSLTVFAAIFALGISVSVSPGRADNDNNGVAGRKADDPDRSHYRRKQWDRP